MNKSSIGRALAGALLAAAPLAHAATILAQAPDIAELSLEQLASITVTTASRRAEALVDAPASIYVITAEDIRRSGANSIPELLRLAPNLQVARADNSQYAISARGFNNVLANKMLVLIDGRTVYTPLFSGVFWEAQDTFLEDIERIEVISGPAATLWGANGVNGVINIITRSSARTKGTLVAGVGGTRESGIGARFGADAFADGTYRVYAKYTDRDHFNLTSGAAIRDASRMLASGLRADWERAGQTFTLQGDGYSGDVDQAPAARSISGGNLLGRWTRSLEAGSGLQLQAYYDRTNRDHPGTFKEALDTFDVELQHTIGAIPGHRLIWGAGYRLSRDRVQNSVSQAFVPADRTLRWGNVFAQDEIALLERLELTLGLKLETNIYTGTEYLPNARLAWHPSPQHLVWAAYSRAVRAPSRIDRDVFFPGVPPFLLVSNTTFESEIARIVEVGYRAHPAPALSFSATAFHHDYPNLRSVGLSPAGPVFANGIEGRVQGVEAWGVYQATPAWRLTGGLVTIHERLRVAPGKVDFGGLASLGNDPNHIALLRSAWDITSRHQLDLALRHAGALKNPVVPSYTVLDARFGWRVTEGLELSLAVQNAFNRDYSEWGVPNNRAMVERAVFLKAVLKL
jgi:iron complex outermembrane receptor protein